MMESNMRIPLIIKGYNYGIPFTALDAAYYKIISMIVEHGITSIVWDGDPIP